ncbi:MAG: ATP-binding cassette domain-containing protein [Proteobacteria bacterium]|nr:ATP-binding cassette domain-containing protein [Pseudomonadota bacterium]
MLIVTDLSKAYGRQVLFDNISFSVNPGERIGFTGRNGSGKTTLFRLILGEEEPDSGKIRIPNGYTIQYLSQHINFTKSSVLEEACLDLKTAEDGRDEAYRVKSILSGLGFSPVEFHRNPQHLSGGFQVRLNLAKILASGPNLLLLDEPTNYLDIVSVRWLIQFLQTWKDELILITHDRAFMNSVTTHTMGIHRQNIRKIAGSTEKLYQQILQDEEVYEKTRANDERKMKEVELFVNRFRAQASRAKAVQSRVRMLEKKEKREKLTEIPELDFSFNSAPFPGKWLIEAHNVSFSFSEDTPPLIHNFRAAIKKSDRIGIIGKNGKGKTTLLNLLAGELQPVQGEIRYNQNLKLAYFGQTNVARLDPDKTVLEEVLDAHPAHSLGSARGICGSMMFDGDNALKKVSVLSGGEKSRVLIGKLLVSPANLILLDEPDNHLDAESIDSLVAAIDIFTGAVLFVTHSEMILRAIATKLIIFDNGKISIFEGSYDDFLERIGWEDEKTITKVNNENMLESQNKGASRKDMRRVRARLIESRSRALGPLQQEIEALEKAITKLENRIEDDNQSLIRASNVGDGKTITSLSISIHSSKIEIEHLFDELDRLTGEHHRKSMEFEEQFDALADSLLGQDRKGHS